MNNYIVASVKEEELDISTHRFESSAWEHAEYLVEEAENLLISMVGVFEGNKCIGHWFCGDGWYVQNDKYDRLTKAQDIHEMYVLKEPRPAEAVYCEVDCIGRR